MENEKIGIISVPPADNSKRVAVIGGGVSGVITASVLKEDGHKVTVYEKTNHLGGVWAMPQPPGTGLQNQFAQYHHPDFPWPSKPDSHAKFYQIYDYVVACSDHYQLNIQLNTEVTKLEGKGGRGEGWKVTIKSNSNEEISEDFDFVVIAQGHFSGQMQKGDLPWTGIDIFEQCGGKVLFPRTEPVASKESLDHELKGKSVIVVGFGKTAIDMCVTAVEHGAQEVHHVFRTARWLIPRYVVGLHNTWLLFNRINSETIPAWDHPHPLLRFAHRHVPMLFHGLWTGIQSVVWAIASSRSWFSTNPRVQHAFRMLRPKHHVLLDHRAASALAPLDYYSMVADLSIIPHRAEVLKCTQEGLLVSNEADGPTTIATDVIIPCIGNGSGRFPYLPNDVREIVEKGNQGLQLYRHLVHPSLDALAFAGWNHGFLHTVHAYLGAIWMSCWMRGEIELPSASDQLAMMERIATWKRTNIDYEPSLNEGIQTRIFHYNDSIMLDLGLNPYRKSNPIKEAIMRYGASDYAGCLSEIQRKRREAMDRGEEFKLKPMDIDM